MTKPGSHGGKATLAKYGRDHFRELGKLGIRTVAQKYFGGSIADAMSYLRAKGEEQQIAALADASGATCVEIPVILDPDDDVFFNMTDATWQERASGGQKDKGRHR